MTTITTIIDCNGQPFPVSTTQQDGESKDDFYARHEAEVAAAKARCDAMGDA